MTVSAIYLDERSANTRRTPDYCFTVRDGDSVEVRRDGDRERLKATREQLLAAGAEATS
jgi:hypothetical protein